MFPGYSFKVREWMGPFIMAGANSMAVKRSQAVLNYSPELIYGESKIHSNIFSALLEFEFLFIFGLVLITTPLSYMVEKWVTQPGDGPTEAQMDKYFLKVNAKAKGDKGT